jgi:hypothetical protein
MAYQDRGDERSSDLQYQLRTASLLAGALVLTAIIYSYFDVGGSAPLTTSFAIGIWLVVVTVLAARVVRALLKKRRSKPSC